LLFDQSIGLLNIPHLERLNDFFMLLYSREGSFRNPRRFCLLIHKAAFAAGKKGGQLPIIFFPPDFLPVTTISKRFSRRFQAEFTRTGVPGASRGEAIFLDKRRGVGIGIARFITSWDLTPSHNMLAGR
jgi:hypothetical protein